MSLIHKTKKEEGKKHKKKKTHTHTQKKQQIFRIKLRNDKFRMFGPHSELISTVPAWFKADFNLFWPFWSVSTVLAAGQYSPILAESKPSQRESKKNKNKNKKTQMWHRRAGSCIWLRQMPHPALGRIELRCGTLPVFQSLKIKSNNSNLTWIICNSH